MLTCIQKEKNPVLLCTVLYYLPSGLCFSKQKTKKTEREMIDAEQLFYFVGQQVMRGQVKRINLVTVAAQP